MTWKQFQFSDGTNFKGKIFYDNTHCRYLFYSPVYMITQTLHSIQTLFKKFDKLNSFLGPFKAKPIEIHIWWLELSWINFVFGPNNLFAAFLRFKNPWIHKNLFSRTDFFSCRVFLELLHLVCFLHRQLHRDFVLLFGFPSFKVFGESSLVG